MKTFGIALLLAATISAKKLPEPTDLDMGVEPDVVVDTDVVEIDVDAEYWDDVKAHNWWYRNLWLGVFQGLYGMSSGGVQRPTEECFGDWIPEKRMELDDLRKQISHDGLWSVSMDEMRSAAYDVVDLIFLNDEYCHFRQAFHDVRAYCGMEEAPCAMGNALENMQKNAFSIITQVSSAAAIFKETPWAEMDKEARAYALNQMGHSMAQLYADMVGFNASKVHAALA